MAQDENTFANEKFERIVAEIYQQWCGDENGHGALMLKLSELPAYQKFKNIAVSEKDDLALFLAEKATIDLQPDTYNRNIIPESYVRKSLLLALLQSKHPFSGAALIRLGLQFLTNSKAVNEWAFFGQPLSYFLRQVQYYTGRVGEMDEALRLILQALDSRLEMVEQISSFIKYKNQLQPMIEALLFDFQSA